MNLRCTHVFHLFQNKRSTKLTLLKISRKCFHKSSSFKKINTFFLNSFSSFSTSYPEAISLLTTMLQTSHTNALLTTTQKNLQHTLPLGSYLLKPVQRILKYHLLLDVNIIDYFFSIHFFHTFFHPFFQLKHIFLGFLPFYLMITRISFNFTESSKTL